MPMSLNCVFYLNSRPFATSLWICYRTLTFFPGPPLNELSWGKLYIFVSYTPSKQLTPHFLAAPSLFFLLLHPRYVLIRPMVRPPSFFSELYRPRWFYQSPAGLPAFGSRSHFRLHLFTDVIPLFTAFPRTLRRSLVRFCSSFLLI